jgi:hypothetical protein
MVPHFRVMHLKSQITAWPTMLGLTEDKWVRLNFEMKAVRWVTRFHLFSFDQSHTRGRKRHTKKILSYSSQSQTRDPLFPTNLTVSRLPVSILQFRMAIIARSQYPEGPATGHLDTGFSWFPCVYKRMLWWFPSFQVATTCLSCSPPDLNFLVTFFFFSYLCTCKITTANCNCKPNCS